MEPKAMEKLLQEIRESQIRTEERMSSAIERMTKHDERLNGHSGRIRKIENRQHWYAGASAIFGAGIMAWLRDKTGL